MAGQKVISLIKINMTFMYLASFYNTYESCVIHVPCNERQDAFSLKDPERIMPATGSGQIFGGTGCSSTSNEAGVLCQSECTSQAVFSSPATCQDPGAVAHASQERAGSTAR